MQIREFGLSEKIVVAQGKPHAALDNPREMSLKKDYVNCKSKMLLDAARYEMAGIS